MKIEELRINNYVYYEHTTHIVSGVHGNKVYSWWVKDGEPVIEYEAKDISGTQVENPYIDVISQYEPIPLTEEWLEKFGFTRQKASGYHGAVSGYHPSAFYFISEGLDEFKQYKHRHNFVFTNVSERRFEPCYQYNGIRDKGLELKYVHQLQNLYYALTGEELKLI